VLFRSDEGRWEPLLVVLLVMWQVVPFQGYVLVAAKLLDAVQLLVVLCT